MPGLPDFTRRCDIHRPENVLEIQSELVVVSAMVHLSPKNFGLLTMFSSPASYTQAHREREGEQRYFPEPPKLIRGPMRL